MILRIAVASALVCAAYGQDSNQERVFPLPHLGTPAAAQEALNAVRTCGDIRDASIVNSGSSFTLAVSSTPIKLALTDWLVQQMDVPQGGNGPGVAEYQIIGDPYPAVAIFHLANPGSPARVQETINILRTAADINRVF